MASAPQSYRDHFVSLLQSAADEVGRAVAGATGLATRPTLENDLVRAVAALGDLAAHSAPIPATAPSEVTQTAWDCAQGGYALLKAVAAGDPGAIAAAKGALKFTQCDPSWAEALVSYADYFGPDGKRRATPYIRAGVIGTAPLPLNAGAKVALIADWGTGTDAAVALLREVARQDPDVVIHLGDIYYSGTAQECDANFQRIVDQVLDRAKTAIPVYTLAGNHDMYSGGVGYYRMLKTLNPAPVTQLASFFCLRSQDGLWQFVAMDTGKNDYDPFNVTDVLTALEKDEEDWHVARIAEFTGKTILLSHHQLFSALSQIGPKQADGTLIPYNPNLAASFKRFSDAASGRIAAWFWGHEHALSLYEPYLGLPRGRCIGHGAVPVFATQSETEGPARLVDPPALRRDVRLGDDGPIYRHGFVMIQLGTDGSATAAYYDSSGGPAMFTETL
jgi:hypothetical protein